MGEGQHFGAVMDFSELTIKLLVLFLPGAASAIIVDKLTVHGKWSSFDFSIHSLVLGFLSYASHQLFWFSISYLTYIPNVRTNIKILNFWDCLFSDTTKVSFSEIFLTLLFSVAIGLIVSAAIQHKVLTKFAQYWNISSKFGDENLYSFFLNSQNVDWITIRDKKAGFTYQGAIDSFSENSSIREVTLRNVKVYTYENSEFCYEVAAMYFSFANGEVKLEVPILNTEEDNGEGHDNRNQ